MLDPQILDAAPDSIRDRPCILDRDVRQYDAKEELRLRCVALIGAGEAIAQDMLRERVTETRAATTMAAAVMAVLGTEG